MRPIPVLLAGFTITAASAAPRIHLSTDTLQPETTVELVLDAPAVGGEVVGKPTKADWLLIEPAWAGTVYWKEPSVLEFRPSEPPKLGGHYVFKVKEGHRYLDNTVVPGGEIAKADAQEFKVDLSTMPNRNDDDWSPRTATCYLRFNGDVTPEKAAPFLFFEADGGKRVAAKTSRATFGQLKYPSYLGASWSERFAHRLNPDLANPELKPDLAPTNGLLVTPLQPLPEGKNWRLALLKGLPDAEGKTTLSQDSTQPIGNIDPLEVKNVVAVSSADEARHIEVSFNVDMPVDLDPKLIEVTPKPKDFRIEVKDRLLTLFGDFSTQKNWHVVLKQGIVSQDGRALANWSQKDIEFKPVDPELVIPSEDEAQLASGTRKYRVQTVNLEKLHVRVKRLEGAAMVRAQQGYRYYTGRGADDKTIDPTHPIPYEMMAGDTVADFEIPLTNAVDTSQPLVLDWDKLLAGYDKPYELGFPKEESGPTPALKSAAAFFIEIAGTTKQDVQKERDYSERKDPIVQALVQLTDIGLAWKIVDNEAHVFAFSTLTGKPQEGVQLTTWGEDAKLLGKAAVTDANGLATLPRNVAARHLQALTKTDSYTVNYDTALPTVSLWRFPVRSSWDETPRDFRKVYLFTDRSLYRPGETMHLKGLIRRQEGNDIVAPPSEKTTVVIVDPQDREILRKPVEPTANGGFDLSFQLPAETTGTHTLRLEFPDEAKPKKTGEDGESEGEDEDNDRPEYSITFRVDEFRRNTFEVKHTVAPVHPGDKEVNVQVKANSFQGQPIANGKVQQFTRISDSNFYPEKYRDYLFGDHRTQDYGYWYHYFGYRWDNDSESSRHSDNVSSETALAADGTVTVTAKLPDGDFPMTREVSVFTEVTDANEQTLNEQSEVTVAPAEVYVGVQRLDRLVRVGDRLPLDIVAVTPDGEKFTGDLTIEANLSREVNEQVRLSDGGRSSAVRNEAKREQLSKTSLTLAGGNSTQFLFAPSQPGLHQIDLRGTDAHGHPFATSVSFQVYGGNEYPWAYEDGMKIKLVAEKKLYQPGETARVLVLSPIEGTALVTVEREKVLKSFITELRADKPVLEIPVTDADAPNVYVSVLVIKGAKDSARLFKEPQLRLGYCELLVNDVRDRLKIDLATPADAVRPGQEMSISGSVTLADGSPAANADVTLYAEDEGTLAVMGYETPDPMAHFYDPRTLRVNCGTTLDKLLSESPEEQTFYNKGFFVGGGDDEAAFKNLPRKDFNPCAIWAPALTTDAAGKFSVKLKMPDTLTRYRVIAVASHGVSKFGVKEGAVTVNKDLMVEPQELRFANEGDTLKVQAHVTNASKTGGVWRVKLDTGAQASEPLATIVNGGNVEAVNLNAGEATTVSFTVKFGNTGDAVFKWTAEPVSLQGAELTPDLKGRLSDSVENAFTVNYPMPLLRQSKLVSLRDGTVDLIGQLDPSLVKGRGTVELEFSRSLLAEAGGSVDFLLHYPYGCVEQTTSSMMPWLAAERLRSVVPAFGKKSPEDVKKAIQSGVNRLLSMQTTDGGFSYWPGGRESVSWASPYAGLGLLLAKEQGASVPESAVEGVCGALERNLRGLSQEKSAYELETACRSIWILALADRHPDAYINTLKGRLPELNLRARCLLALAAKRANNGADAVTLLRDKTPFKGRDDRWMRYEADLPLALLAWTTIEPTAKETDMALAGLLQDRDPYATWRTTWVNAWALLGLGAYAEHETDRTPAAVALSTPDGQKDLTVAINSAAANQSFVLSPSLKLTAKSDHPAYVRVKIASKPDLLPSKPVAKNGLEITRFYERVNPDGTTTPLDLPKKGDLVRVTLKVEQPRDYSRYLVVEDYLPSIFEAVNNDFGSQAANPNAGGTSERSWAVSHSEIRADRVMFFFDDAYRGTTSLTYLARCTMEGKATAPPAKIESMYDPDSIALSASRSF